MTTTTTTGKVQETTTTNGKKAAVRVILLYGSCRFLSRGRSDKIFRTLQLTI